MSKTQRSYTPEQERAMAIARVERQMSAADVVAAARAGELDGLESFDPSTSTVDRCKRALEEERSGMTSQARYRALEGEVFSLLEALAREVHDERKATGKVNPSKTRQLAQGIRNLSQAVPRTRASAAPPEPDEDGPETDDTSPLLARLSTAQRSTGDNGGATRSAASHEGRVRAAS